MLNMRYFILLLLIVSFISCREEKKDEDVIDLGAEKTNLLNTDKAFSALSAKEGMKAAFIEYIDSNGVLLKPNYMPIIGANAIDYLIQQNDTAYVLTWQPQTAVVSKSADLGYTYGIYAIQAKAADTILYGTYVSIWKKQRDSTWKFVLDSGNEGIGEY